MESPLAALGFVTALVGTTGAYLTLGRGRGTRRPGPVEVAG